MDATESRPEATYPVRFDVEEFISRAAKRGARLHQDRAELIGVNRSTLDRWQTGQAVPRLDTALYVAKQLDTTVDKLWRIDLAEVPA
jgi:DNA-binding XRE family transcriptional regulator